MCSERPITICAVVKAWLCQGSRIWIKTDVTTRLRPMSALVSFTFITEKLARQYAQNATFGYSPQLVSYPLVVFKFI